MRLARLLVIVVVVGVGCTGGSSGTSEQEVGSAQTVEPSGRTQDVQKPPPRDARIYSAVIRQLLADTRQMRPDIVYVINGAIAGAGRSLGDPFGPSAQPFSRNVIDGIREQLTNGLPPFRFIADGNDVLRRDGAVKHGGVMISLGSIERTSKRRVLVPSTFWCGGKCSQWQTYVVSNKNGRWRITGLIGAVITS